jgi:DNA-3-methyladenine glycosylase
VAHLEAPAVPPEGAGPLSRRSLPRSFFERPAVEVAPDLLGRVLVRMLVDGRRLSGRIVEAEAYEPGDPASHGFRRMTARNRTMFGPAGHLYVYFTYGNHWMLNVVTRRAGEPSAVLLRALEPLEGLDAMRAARHRNDLPGLCSGPGKLAQALSVDQTSDGVDLVGGADLWLEAGRPLDAHGVQVGPRVGLSVGVDEPWRFRERGSPFVSKGRPGPASLSRRRSATP